MGRSGTGKESRWGGLYIQNLVLSTLLSRYLKIHFTNKRNKTQRLHTMESSHNCQMKKPEFNTGFYNLKLFQSLWMPLPNHRYGEGREREKGIYMHYLMYPSWQYCNLGMIIFFLQRTSGNSRVKWHTYITMLVSPDRTQTAGSERRGEELTLMFITLYYIADADVTTQLAGELAPC